MKKTVALFGLFLHVFCCKASEISLIEKNETDSSKVAFKIVAAESILYSASMLYLGSVWYDGGNDGRFRFFNDFNQWNQLDKIGHAFSAYHLTNANFLIFKRFSNNHNKTMLWSAIASTAMLLPIEIFDGFSPQYGASWSDFGFNAMGAFLPFQQLLFENDYFHPKFSFFPSNWASIRPETLGESFATQLLKDYNGQTYWISTNLNLFSRNNVFPEWLAFSFGYGAEQMIYGNPTENRRNGYNSYRQFYLSLDIDFTKFRTHNKFLNSILYILNTIKFPFPTLEWNRHNKLIFHPIYF